MSRRRYLSTNISLDPRVNQLAVQGGDFAALLYTWMIPHATDDGALPSDPEELLYLVIPGRRDKTREHVFAAVEHMAILGLVVVDGDRLTFPWADFRTARHPVPSPARRAWERIAKRIRGLVLERDGHRCRYCGATDPLEVDHIIPLARGGGNELANLQTLCRPCNRHKWAS